MLTKLKIKQWLGLSPEIPLQSHLQTEFHGSDYGGWTIQQGSVDENSKIISAGIGNDITFDLSIIQRYGATIRAIDPTPQVGAWLGKQDLPPGFLYSPVGLAANDGATKFFNPANSAHVSHSQRPADKKSKEFIVVPVMSLQSLLHEYHWKSIDLLKMDIEGFEYEVIDNIVSQHIPVSQLLVEFHHGLYGYTNGDTSNAIRLLNKAGFQTFSISGTGREVSFIHA